MIVSRVCCLCCRLVVFVCVLLFGVFVCLCVFVCDCVCACLSFVLGVDRFVACVIDCDLFLLCCSSLCFIVYGFVVAFVFGCVLCV